MWYKYILVDLNFLNVIMFLSLSKQKEDNCVEISENNNIEACSGKEREKRERIINVFCLK